MRAALRLPHFSTLARLLSRSVPSIASSGRFFTSSASPLAPIPPSKGMVPLIEYADASEGVKAVYEDIVRKRNLAGPDRINNFWKAIANDEVLLRRTWTSLQEVMGPGELPPLFKEMIYVAVSAVNNCEYCLESHAAAAKKQGMTREMFMELLSVVSMASETNRLAVSLKVPVDEVFEKVAFPEKRDKSNL
ncbi:AhpD-like protein [Gonapodya prolifera JEL478]|uniref:AhpD-like protein n=1 Tax=Gonapodya prolifera (strain JEL478) TaxID=1344416 RepID=A0A139AUG8_GONPJ|nr:AhpD-like protein [Gonapodya prolifera JEL478]|eukprot:KXS20372.1 AhpD-like protein [Gonapodya prolifera JEL478]